VEGIPAGDMIEEERPMTELKQMINGGRFVDGLVKIDLFTAASVRNGRFPIKRKRAVRCKKEDCWVLFAEERAGEDDYAGMYDLWMSCARHLVKLQWRSEFDQEFKELKLVLGDGHLLSIVHTKLGNTSYNMGKLEFEEGSTAYDVGVLPSLLRKDMDAGAAGEKINMVAPVRCAVCTCLEMSLPEMNDVLYIPCLKLGNHG
jgi:hypothetical protein